MHSLSACVVLSTKSSCLMLPGPVKAHSWCSIGSIQLRGRPGCDALSGSQTILRAKIGDTMCRRVSLSARPGL